MLNLPNVVVILCRVCKGTGLVFDYKVKCVTCNGQGGTCHLK